MALVKDILRTMDYGPSPEGSEPVRAWLDEHRGGFGHFINGAFIASKQSMTDCRRAAQRFGCV